MKTYSQLTPEEQKKAIDLFARTLKAEMCDCSNALPDAILAACNGLKEPKKTDGSGRHCICEGITNNLMLNNYLKNFSVHKALLAIYAEPNDNIVKEIEKSPYVSE